jgi:hypothetical protein
MEDNQDNLACTPLEIREIAKNTVKFFHWTLPKNVRKIFRELMTIMTSQMMALCSLMCIRKSKWRQITKRIL